METIYDPLRRKDTPLSKLDFVIPTMILMIGLTAYRVIFTGHQVHTNLVVDIKDSTIDKRTSASP